MDETLKDSLEDYDEAKMDAVSKLIIRRQQKFTLLFIAIISAIVIPISIIIFAVVLFFNHSDYVTWNKFVNLVSSESVWSICGVISTILLTCISVYILHKTSKQNERNLNVSMSRNIPDFQKESIKLDVFYSKNKKLVWKVKVTLTNVGGETAYLDVVTATIIYKNISYSGSAYAKKYVRPGASFEIFFEEFKDVTVAAFEEETEEETNTVSDSKCMSYWKIHNISFYTFRHYKKLDVENKLKFLIKNSVDPMMAMLTTNSLERHKIASKDKIGVIGIVYRHKDDLKSYDASSYRKEIVCKLNLKKLEEQPISFDLSPDGKKEI